ncbi:MAG: addiction module protein [Gemmatimonadota bacterium]|jgi:putative addiction module component (TIGR02574 family)
MGLYGAVTLASDPDMVFCPASAQIGSMVKMDIETIKRLSVRERVRLVQEIWDTLQPTASELPVTDEQRDIVTARLERHRRDPSAAIPWSEVRRELGLE